MKQIHDYKKFFSDAIEDHDQDGLESDDSDDYRAVFIN